MGTILLTNIGLILILALTAYWNGLVINWKQNKNGKEVYYSKLWHSVGLMIRIIILVLMMINFNIYFLIGGVILSSILYNMIINLTMGSKLFYIGRTSTIDKLIRKILNLK